MKHLLLTTIAAVVLVGCGESQQSAPAPEAKPVEPVAKAEKPEPPTAKAPDISIHDAAYEGNIEAVKQHLAAGTDVDAKDMNGETPLTWAAYQGYKEIAELLIAKGADVNAKTKDGWGEWWTVLDWAELVRKIHVPGYKESPKLIAARKEIPDLLRKHGGMTGEELRSGMTPLHAAARKGLKEVVELLIANGADVNAKDHRARTPLHIAAQKGHKETVELLIAKGAKVNTKDYFDKTPLDRAEEVNEADSAELKAAKKEIADLLRKHELNQLMPRLVQHGRFAFSFIAKEGKVYEVQDSFDLLNWEVIKTYTGTGASVRFDEERDHDPPKWFYRVRVGE